MDNSIGVKLPFIRIDKEKVKSNKISENQKNLSDNEKKLYKFIDENRAITRKKAEELLGLSKTQSYQILKKMIDREIVISAGKGRKILYLIRGK